MQKAKIRINICKTKKTTNYLSELSLYTCLKNTPVAGICSELDARFELLKKKRRRCGAKIEMRSKTLLQPKQRGSYLRQISGTGETERRIVPRNPQGPLRPLRNPSGTPQGRIREPSVRPSATNALAPRGHFCKESGSAAGSRFTA